MRTPSAGGHTTDCSIAGLPSSGFASGALIALSGTERHTAGRPKNCFDKCRFEGSLYLTFKRYLDLSVGSLHYLRSRRPLPCTKARASACVLAKIVVGFSWCISVFLWTLSLAGSKCMPMWFCDHQLRQMLASSHRQKLGKLEQQAS